MKKNYLLILLIVSIFYYGCNEKEKQSITSKKKVFEKTGSVDISCDYVYRLDGEIAAFADGKLYVIKNDIISEEKELPVLKRKKVIDIYKLKNYEKYVFATDRGILSGGSSIKQLSSYKANCVISVDRDILVGTDNGIVVFDEDLREIDRLDEKNSFFREYLQNKDLSERLLRVNAIQSDEENIFIGTDEGLIITDKEFKKADFYYADYFVPSFSNELIRHSGNSPLAGSVINFIKKIKDDLYIGTNAGISIYNKSARSWKSFISQNSKTGNSELPGNFIRFIEEVDDFIIAGTNKGLSIFSKEKQDFIPLLYRQNVISIFKEDTRIYVVTEFDGIQIFSLMEVEIEDSNR